MSSLGMVNKGIYQKKKKRQNIRKKISLVCSLSHVFIKSRTCTTLSKPLESARLGFFFFCAWLLDGIHTPYMYAVYVCLICMPYMYALYVCLICMPYMYALYVTRQSTNGRICAWVMERARYYVYALYVCLICMPYMYALYVTRQSTNGRICAWVMERARYYVYALYVCLTYMPYMYALHVCPMCMP